MFSFFRAGTMAAAAACLAVVAFSARAADKPFTNDDLANSAVELEAQIKSDAGVATKPVDQLRRDADAAFSKNDFRSGMTILGQIVAAVPADATTWLRLARTIQQIRPADDRERAMLLERASTAAYIAYQRTADRNQEADGLAFLGTLLSQRRLWRPALDALRLSLELREVADVRGQYERLRDQYGFRVLDYTIDADTASPRACFQFSEDLPARTDFSPYVVLAGTDKPALSVAEKQLCVEGLQHGEHYTVTLRAGLPSMVHETLSKSSDFAIYVRDRKPFVRFSTSAYVLPRVGQQGIPVISVNTRAVAIEIYRIGDRSLIDTIAGAGYANGDFQQSLDRYDVNRLAKSRGVAVWKGELAVDAQPLNAEVTTAFPVDQAVGELKPGVYVMVAQPQEDKNLDNDYDSLATQWFIVSDLGLTAFSGNDGIHVFVNSLATAQAKNGIELRLISRGNEVLATRHTDAAGQALFEAGLANGEGAAAPALLAAADPQGDYAFLNLRTPGFDLTDRGVAGRPAPNGLDAFVYAERGVYRSGETVYLTALVARRAGCRRAQCAADARGRTARWRRIQARGRCRSGLGRLQPGLTDQRLGADRHLARARFHRSEARRRRRNELSGRRLCPRSDRLRSDFAGRTYCPKRARRNGCRRALSLWRAGGESRPRRRHDDRARPRAVGLCRLSVWARRRRGRSHPAVARRSAVDRRGGQCEVFRQSRQAAVEHASARSADRRAHERSRRPRRRAQAHFAGDAERQHDRRQAAVLGPLRSPTAPAPIST